LGRVGGPALGAALVGWVGSSGAFALNGLSFVISAAFLLPLSSPAMRREIRSTERSENLNPLQDLRQGIATVLASPWLWISIAIFSLTNITLAGPYSVAMPFLVSDSLKADVGTLGLLYAMFPLGYVAAGIWLGRYQRLRRRGLVMYGMTALAAALLGVFGLLPPLWVLIVAALVNGAALEIGHLIWINTMQEMVPNEQLGRVASIDAVGSFGLLPIGLAAAGWATNRLGAPFVFILGGGFTALISLLALAHPAIRRLD
jgi:DHA3 family tetracycline resistance protein-like MFS transporter